MLCLIAREEQANAETWARRDYSCADRHEWKRNTASVAPTVMGGSGNAASVALVAITGTANAASQDPIEALLQHPPPRAGDPRHHAHSDFTDPLGRFMDSLAAGAFADARALQPAACNAWRTSRQTTAVSGKFRVWDTEIDLDTLCPAG